jgi:tRNA modification GTPase
VSCRTGAGLDRLRERIVAVLGFGAAGATADLVAINARHRDCLARAREAMLRAAAMLRERVAPEFIAVELREAMERVGAVAGQIDTEEILDGIFSRFCIGK